MKKESTKEMIIRKLTSRKLWLAVCSFVSLLMIAKGFPEAETAQVTAIIMAGASVLAYIISEGMVDGGPQGRGRGRGNRDTCLRLHDGRRKITTGAGSFPPFFNRREKRNGKDNRRDNAVHSL